MGRNATSLVLLTLALVAAPAASAQDVPEGSAEAVGEFAQGMKLYVAADYEHALTHFVRAHEIDPSFVVALFFAGLMQRNAGNFDQADSLYSIVEAQKERLSPYYRQRLETGALVNRGDAVTGLDHARRLAAIAPGTKAVYNYGLYAQRMNRPREAVDALLTLDRTREPMKGWASYWSVLASSQHMMGDHAAELETVEDWSRRFGAPLYVNRAVALAAQGRTEEAWAQLDDAAASNPSGGWNSGAFAAAVWAELDAHGHEDGARRVRQEFLRRNERIAAEGSTGARAWYAFSLAAEGRDDEAAAIYGALGGEDPDNVYWRSYAALLAGRRGNGAALTETDRWLADRDAADPRSGARAWRAYLAAEAGDAGAALDHLRSHMATGQVYSVWWHRDPVFVRLARQDPSVRSFFRGEG